MSSVGPKFVDMINTHVAVIYKSENYKEFIKFLKKEKFSLSFPGSKVVSINFGNPLLLKSYITYLINCIRSSSDASFRDRVLDFCNWLEQGQPITIAPYGTKYKKIDQNFEIFEEVGMDDEDEEEEEEEEDSDEGYDGDGYY